MSWYDGVPLAEAVADAAAAVGDGSVLGGAGAAISGVSAVADIAADPIGSFFGAGFGWVIEHVPVLKSALDAVSGDPDAIEAVCTTWAEQVGAPLAGVGGDIAAASRVTTEGFMGEAGEAYRGATDELAAHSDALATAARATATGLQFAGSIVLEVRSYIRDELSSFLGWVAAGAAIAAASSVPTAGASVATFTNTTLLRAAQLGRKFTQVLRRLVGKLDDFAGRLGRLGGATDALRRTRPALARATDSAVAKWAGAAPSAPGTTDVVVALTGSVAKAAGDGWSTWTRTGG